MLETCRKVAIKIRPYSRENGSGGVFQMVLVMPLLSADQTCSAMETLHGELANGGWTEWEIRGNAWASGEASHQGGITLPCIPTCPSLGLARGSPPGESSSYADTWTCRHFTSPYPVPSPQPSATWKPEPTRRSVSWRNSSPVITSGPGPLPIFPTWSSSASACPLPSSSMS